MTLPAEGGNLRQSVKVPVAVDVLTVENERMVIHIQVVSFHLIVHHWLLLLLLLLQTLPPVHHLPDAWDLIPSKMMMTWMALLY